MNPIERQLSDAGVLLTPSLRAAVSLALVSEPQERSALLQRFGIHSADLKKVLDVLNIEIQDPTKSNLEEIPKEV